MGLDEYLREQVGFLRKRGAAFDAGDVAEAKPIATAIRVLVHEGTGKSLLRQLRVKDSLRFIDSSPEIPQGTIVITFAGLGVVRINGDTGITDFAAPLGDRPERPRLKFGAWWSAKVLTDQEGNAFNRQDLVLGWRTRRAVPTSISTWIAPTGGSRGATPLGWRSGEATSGSQRAVRCQ